jgi:hypothetical protein
MHDDRIAAQVKQVWENVLGTDVDAETNFFEVGGHSFLAIRIVALLDQSLPEPTPLATVFDHPVLGDFTDAVTQRLRSAAAN